MGRVRGERVRWELGVPRRGLDKCQGVTDGAPWGAANRGAHAATAVSRRQDGAARVPAKGTPAQDVQGRPARAGATLAGAPTRAVLRGLAGQG